MSATDIPIFWSAGGGVGWPQSVVLDLLGEKYGFPDRRSALIWPWGSPLPVERGRPDPVIITCDPEKASIALLAGYDVAYLPSLLPPPIPPPLGYSEFYCSTGDPWLVSVQ